MYVIRDKIKYRAKVRTKSQSGNTGFTDGLLYNEMEVRYVQIEERAFTAFYNDGDVKIEDYNVPKEDWERHIIFSKDIMEGVIFGKNVDSDDIISFREYFSQCGFDHLFIKQAN